MVQSKVGKGYVPIHATLESQWQLRPNLLNRNGGKERCHYTGEAFLNLQVIFTALENRGIFVQEEVKNLESLDDMILA